jgi:hypothetical protein
MVFVGCGLPGPAGSDSSISDVTTSVTAASAPTTTTHADGLEVIVAPTPDGELPPDLILGCPHGPTFPVRALDDIRPLEDDDADGFSGAIEPFLENAEGQHWPQQGWRLLHEDGSRAILVALTETGNLAFMFLDNQDGAWMWSGSSMQGDPCDLQFTVGEGLNTVQWRLDPAAPPPGPDDRHVAVILNESECVSGQPIGERLVGPQVVMTDTNIHIAFAANPPPGDAFDCQGNPDTPFTVELPQPIGDRVIVEGLDTGLSLEDYLR